MRLRGCFSLLLLTFSLRAAEVTPEEFNQALGISLFADANLWDDEAGAVAARLGWPKESETSQDSSFRKYPGAKETILGCRPYSCSLLAENGTPSSLSIMFANKGDAVDYSAKSTDPKVLRERQAQIQDFKKSIQQDARALQAALTKLLGDPVQEKLGQGRQTSETARRWNWNGHAILLASPRDEYVALRIMSAKSADEGGRSRIPDSELMARAKSRVERRPNGDVVLKDIPMVNQGPKGYCAPATWERAMRYMGVPADMYVLAMAGQSGAGGGTSVAALAEGAREAVVRAGRKIEQAAMKIEPAAVSKYVDRGLPIMWAMYSTKAYNAIADARTKARAEVTDPAEWKKRLADAKKDLRTLKVEKDAAHVCMIIGYNRETGEIAVSDSWGPTYAERWITAAEAQAVSQNNCMVIVF